MLKDPGPRNLGNKIQKLQTEKKRKISFDFSENSLIFKEWLTKITKTFEKN